MQMITVRYLLYVGTTDLLQVFSKSLAIAGNTDMGR